MASSRLERIGTIFTRTQGLIQSKALNWEDRPLWYDVYAAFPPKETPQYDRPVPNIKLKNIFYPEDRIRAIFHRNNKRIGATHLAGGGKSLTQKFIDVYSKLSVQYDGTATEEQIYKEAIEVLNRERGGAKEAQPQQEPDDVESVSLSMAFKEAQRKQQDQGISVRDIFKD
ncbi:probable 28S ribosomal protein S23, mitochondrial [Anthonomus grandis grandis]|uniref:probable 28S ribosomal protein S23, mitochondrial n=1 Tax=Anthonomus grandis grandis TaxID=2921223 RepID=UPI002165481C|nr:probable 28S ribosomal protein S23, mitochondrial [Anthonomus grandis grandis]